MNTHGIERTSPKGEKFFGACRYCGTPNLPMGAALAPCAVAPSRDRQILDAVAPPAVRTEKD